MNTFKPEKCIRSYSRLVDQFQKDFAILLHASLNINDQLKIDIDHVEYEGGMSQVESFREMVNQLHHKYREFV